jgi:multiple sugar transport system ATP-binding protein
VRYTGRKVVVGVRSEHLTEAAGAPSEGERLRGRARSVELLGAERLVRVELPVTPVERDDARKTKSDNALVTARFDAHTPVVPGDLVDLAVNTARLRFFDLTTGRAIS